MLRNLTATHFLRITLCLICFTYLPMHPLTASEDDVATLQKEIKELKQEIETLRGENMALRTELRKLKKQAGESKTPDEPTDAIVGKIWEIVATDQSGKRYGPFRFLAHDGNIYVGDLEQPRVGYYTEKGPNVRIDVTNSKYPAANGVYSLIHFSKSPLTYRGRLTNVKGHYLDIELRIIED